jgi:hypothetical protein
MPTRWLSMFERRGKKIGQVLTSRLIYWRCKTFIWVVLVYLDYIGYIADNTIMQFRFHLSI